MIFQIKELSMETNNITRKRERKKTTEVITIIILQIFFELSSLS